MPDNPITAQQNQPDIVSTMTPSHPDPSHDKLFGNDGSDPIANSNNPAVGDPIAVPNQRPNMQQQRPNTQQNPNERQPQQSEPGKPLTVEQLETNYKGLQSKYDVQTAEYNQYRTSTEPMRKFVEAFDTDEAVRLALIAEYHPDLVKSQNPKELAEKQLKQEFGEDFDYDTASTNDKILYSERLKETYNQHRTGSNIHSKTLKELKAERKKIADTKQAQYQTEKSGIMQRQQWNDNQFGNFLQWAQNATLDQLSDSYLGIMANVANSQIRLNSVSSIPGAPQTVNSETERNNILFGTREPDFLSK